jgi:hypothetical protein
MDMNGKLVEAIHVRFDEANLNGVGRQPEPKQLDTPWDDLTDLDYLLDTREDDAPPSEDEWHDETPVIGGGTEEGSSDDGGDVGGPSTPTPATPVRQIRSGIPQPAKKKKLVISGVVREVRRSQRTPVPRVSDWNVVKSKSTAHVTNQPNFTTSNPYEILSKTVYISWTYKDYVAMEPGVLKQKISDALIKEVNNFKDYGVFEEIKLSEIPKGKNILQGKWVITEKKDETGQYARKEANRNIKARWVARGFTQIPGEDFFDTYAPVVDAASLRILLMLMVQFGLRMHRSDVPAAYLNGPTDVELFTTQMLEFGTAHHVTDANAL